MPLADWLERLLTTCPAHLRDMGYLRELLGIRARYRRWRREWEPHCRRSRELILRAARRCGRRRRAVVLGSGFLHDVPLEELAGCFREVVLVDLVHPLSTRWRVRRLGGVRLLAADVTGTLEGVWEAAHDRGKPLPASAPGLFVGDGEVDLSVSLNLLSQLPCMPEQYLRRAGQHPAGAILAYCRGLVEAHLGYLERLPGVVCLVADVEARTVDLAGRVVRREDTLYGVPFPYEGEGWTWPLVPGRGEHLAVVGVEDVKEAKRRS